MLKISYLIVENNILKDIFLTTSNDQYDHLIIPIFELEPHSVYFSRIVVNIGGNNNIEPLKENAGNGRAHSPIWMGCINGDFPL